MPSEVLMSDEEALASRNLVILFLFFFVETEESYNCHKIHFKGEGNSRH